MRAQGFRCDRPGCKSFDTSPDDRTIPYGWMTVTVSVDPRAAGANANVNNTFHICSARCLRDLGKSRITADVELASLSNGAVEPEHRPVTSSGREYSPEARAKFRQNGMRIQHTKGNHAEANPDCEMCQEELGMSADDIRELIRQGS